MSEARVGGTASPGGSVGASACGTGVTIEEPVCLGLSSRRARPLLTSPRSSSAGLSSGDCTKSASPPGDDGKTSLSSSSAGLGGMKPREGGVETCREAGTAKCVEVERVRAVGVGAPPDDAVGGSEMRRSTLLEGEEEGRGASEAVGAERCKVARALVRAALASRMASSQRLRSSWVSVGRHPPSALSLLSCRRMRPRGSAHRQRRQTTSPSRAPRTRSSPGPPRRVRHSQRPSRPRARSARRGDTSSPRHRPRATPPRLRRRAAGPRRGRTSSLVARRRARPVIRHQT